MIVTSSLERARELIRRELQNERCDVTVEICEGAQLLWTETLACAPKSPPARRRLPKAA